MNRIILENLILLILLIVVAPGCDSETASNVDPKSPDAYYYNRKYSVSRNIGIQDGYFYDKLYPFKFLFPEGWYIDSPYDTPGGRIIDLTMNPQAGQWRWVEGKDADYFYPNIEVNYRYETSQQGMEDPISLQMARDFPQDAASKILIREVQGSSKFDLGRITCQVLLKGTGRF